MTRITNAMKDAIVNKALEKSGATSRIEAIKIKRFEWAEIARVHALGGEAKAREYAEINKHAHSIYSSLPQGLKGNANIVERRSDIHLNLAGASIRVKLKGYAEASDHREIVLADNPLCQQFYDIEAEEKAACEQGTVVENQVRATLDKFGTVKRLIEAWPEVQELLPPATVAAKSNLPAIQVADLNKLVGLKAQ